MGMDHTIDFLVKRGVLQFGEFKLKGGRPSPYFFNTGCLDDGEGLAFLGMVYSDAAFNLGTDKFDVIFGPAYKGISLADACATAMYQRYDVNKRRAYNRKEAKTHGDERVIDGTIREGDRILLLDDVITTGGTKIEALKLLDTLYHNLSCTAMIVMLDRQEATESGHSAAQQFTLDTGISVTACLTARDIIGWLNRRDPEKADRIKSHLEKYGTEKILEGL